MSASSSPSPMVNTGSFLYGRARTASATELAIASGIIPQSPNERDLLIVSLLQKAGIRDNHALSKIVEHRLDYDLIILTRGGGCFEDLFGFCKPELIECIHKLKIPLLLLSLKISP